MFAYFWQLWPKRKSIVQFYQHMVHLAPHDVDFALQVDADILENGSRFAMYNCDTL